MKQPKYKIDDIVKFTTPARIIDMGEETIIAKIESIKILANNTIIYYFYGKREGGREKSLTRVKNR